MKIGSIVECVNDKSNPLSFMKVERLPTLKEILTIRTIQNDSTTNNEDCITFEEYCMGINTNNGKELVAPVKMFRELLPPEEQINTEELLKELQLEQV